jgi:hypothetical protein
VRRLAVEAGLPAASAEAGIDATVATWTPRAWRALAARELTGPEGRRHAARGGHRQGDVPAAAFGATAGVVPHVLGGSLPGPNLLPVFFTLLAGGAPLVRAGRRAPSLAALGLASVAAVDPELGIRGAVCRWSRERGDLLRALFEGAPVASVTGGDAAVAAVRDTLPSGTRLLAHAHRVSAAAAGSAGLSRDADLEAAARRIARDVTLHDQQGCLSPVGVLAVGGGAARAEALALALAAELARLERRRPRAQPEPHEAAALRTFHDAFAAGGRRRGATRVLAGEGLSWIVGLLRFGERPPPSPLLRSVWVLPVANAAAAERALEPWRGRLAGLGVHGTSSERRSLRAAGRALGARWLPRAGSLQSPPLAWRRDGIRPVADLLTPAGP